MKKNNFILFFILGIFIFSCSSETVSSSNETNDNSSIYPMNVIYNAENISLKDIDNNTESDPSGGQFGFEYQLLYGFNDSSVSKSSISRLIPGESRKIEISLAIPKDNITIGEHLFTNSILPLEYFGKVNLKINNVVITTNTTNGKIKVLSYNNSTKIIEGTYQIITNDGNNVNYNLTGSFKYKLID